MKELPKLYAITDCQLSNCTNIEIVRMMLDGGARIIQLRDKEASSRELLEQTRDCLKLTREAGAMLIVNDRADIALTAGADGVHLGQDDMTVADAREMLGEDKIIGLSTHSIDQFRAALETSANYITVGPIYPTTTKENLAPVVGLDLIREAKGLADRPLVAIGGINHERAPEVFAAGADCVAAISALYPWPEVLELTSRPDITGSVRRFIEVI
ncbi:MAG TPA: thiamine phosphate synthase [Blastocatellia bacterium]|nr:thiamine phosphate synthase [Blastocatellia bacterium]